MSAVASDDFVPDEEGFEEDEDQELRHRLGLRPIWYLDRDVEAGPHSHPDPGTCPPWCWIAQPGNEGYGHEMEPGNPFRASHRLEPAPSIVASFYSGESVHLHEQPPGTRTATIEVNLAQRGQGDPRIDIGLRQYQHRRGVGWEQVYDYKRLQLSLDDTQELVTSLQYVLEQARGESK